METQQQNITNSTKLENIFQTKKVNKIDKRKVSSVSSSSSRSSNSSDSESSVSDTDSYALQCKRRKVLNILPQTMETKLSKMKKAEYGFALGLNHL